jgi:hypothetical protein
MASTTRSSQCTQLSSTLQRCTPGGRMLNQRYKTTEAVDRMQAEFKLIDG